MKFVSVTIIVLALFCSCNQSSSSSDVTLNYIDISTAIKMSKASRLKFQDKFVTILDSLLANNTIQINTQELSVLLDSAKKDNQRAKQLVESANEIDSSLKYKEESLKMFTYLERLYTKEYPEIIRIFKNGDSDRIQSVSKILTPTTDSFKIMAIKVINIGNSIREKYQLHLQEIEN
jgi:hypothetical protein